MLFKNPTEAHRSTRPMFNGYYNTVNSCVPFKTNKLWIEYTLKNNPMFYTLKVYQQCRISYSAVDIDKLEIGLLLNCDKHVLIKELKRKTLHLKLYYQLINGICAILFSHLLQIAHTHTYIYIFFKYFFFQCTEMY